MIGMSRSTGLAVTDLIDQPVNNITRLRLMSALAAAYIRFEPRVRIQRVQLLPSPDAQHVLFDYMDLDQVIGTQQQLKVMARQRIESLDLDHPDVERFWEVYEYMEHGRDILINHHKDTDPTVAINLNDFYKWAYECRQSLPDLNLIKQLLVGSKSYAFIKKNHPVRKKGDADVTQSNKTIKCWIFKKPLHHKLTQP